MSKPLSAAAAAKVATKLTTWFSQAGRRGLGGRTQIIDPRLCTDVLERLAPSLEKHKGCNLIDVNPGMGLWSTYLHHHLKPRRHILLEPDYDFFEPYLKPLIAEDPERIVLTDKSLKQVFQSEELLGKKTNPRDEIGRMTTVNNDILLNINLAGRPRVRNVVPVVGTQDKYLWNNIFQSFKGVRDDLWDRGLIRILAWLADEQKSVPVPRNAHDVVRQSVDLALSTRISEVAGCSSSNQTHNPRLFDIEVEDANRLKSSGTAAEVSAIRTDLPPLPPAVHFLPEVKTLRSAEMSQRPPWVDKLIELDASVQKSNPAIYQKFAPRWKSLERSPTKPRLRNPEPVIKEWVQLNTRLRAEHVQYLAVTKVVHDQRALEQEWRATADDSDPRIPGFLDRAAKLRTSYGKLRDRDQITARGAIDDYRLLDVGAGQWHRRTTDPLIVHPREFAQHYNPLALLDITPKPEFRARLDTELKLCCLDYVVSQLMHKPNLDIESSLIRFLIPGGIEEFLETVPSLKDIRKGGYYDLKELRVRTIPPWLWEDIALAYEAWPFRASYEQMVFGPQARNLAPKGPTDRSL